MMEVVVPEPVEAVTAFGHRTNQTDVLRLIFSDDDDRSVAGGAARTLGDFLKDVRR